MVQSGRDSPEKVVKVTKASPSPKWVFRLPNARRKLKRSATPHPGRVGGNTKRDARVSLTETGRVRKKIVFELEELVAGIDGVTNVLAGEDKVSSPTGERKGGRWLRRARPGPFEANNGAPDLVPGVLPLLAEDLRFSMGQKEVSARNQPEVAWNQPEVAAGTGLTGAVGTRPEVDRPEENSAVALGVSRSAHVEVDASLATMDEDTLQNGDGANMLSESTILAAPFPEMPSCALDSETCDLSQGKNEFEFENAAGTPTLPKEADVVGKSEADGKSPAPENSPELDTAQHDNAKSQPDNPALDEGSVAAPFGRPLEPNSSPAAELENGGASASGPVILDVGQDREMGTAGRCEGVPSLTFSNEETKALADKIGHAIIGKFSHTIPTPQQIQKSLSHIQFIDGFKWKFVNAKHILIQFRDARDYGRMLNGPSGMPVWHIESHPMRVFKWTPDFDTFFESPIAVVWCRVIGLPIHLYDQSALIAIGKLLGRPIQADRATLNQSRLTFARICIEIDISTPPPEEIILNILGKDTRYKVVWERIPLFCVECKHVGHVKEACYTLRKKEEQPTKEPSRPSHTRRPNFVSEANRRAWRPKKPSAGTHNPKPDQGPTPEEATEPGPSKEKRGADETPRMKAPTEVQIQVDEDGFQLVSKRRKGKPFYSPHQAQRGAHRANYLETLLKGSNVATVSFGKANAEVIDPGGSSTNLN